MRAPAPSVAEGTGSGSGLPKAPVAVSGVVNVARAVT